MKKQTDYYQIVNFNKDTNEVTMLDYTFNHGDGFKGATGTTFQIVSKKEYKEAIKKDNVINLIIDCCLNKTGREINSIYRELKENDEIDKFMFDLSYIELHDNIRKELKLSKNECYIFTCTGGGRCFDTNFQGNFNVELSQIIRDYETK